ncbi:methyltransferase family protein [Kaarinaea lacus]
MGNLEDTSTKKKLLPPSYLAASLLAISVLHFTFPVVEFISFPWNFLGVLPLLIGVGLNLLADRAFKKANTTVKPFEESTAMLTDGVFRISRHPMYLGMVLILLGISILLGSLSSLIVTAVFAVIIDRVFIIVEERMMEQTFGGKYVDYKKQVRKWL